jgi:ribose-phosphate pyrophosphokinase
VTSQGLIGDVRGCVPVIVDDMISTGGTIEAAVRVLTEQGCGSGITVLATHAVFAEGAVQRLTALPLKRIIVTDTVAGEWPSTDRVQVVSVAGLLADEIRAAEASSAA